MAKLGSSVVHGTLDVTSNADLKNTISVRGQENIDGNLSNIENGWIKLKDEDGNILMGIDNKEIALENELKITTSGNGLNVDGPIKENGIALNDTYLSLSSAQSGFKQSPLDSIHGSITARSGRLYTSRAFNNITDLNLASVKHYGDNAIITTPTNKFNCIIEKDKIYTGPSYKNIANVGPKTSVETTIQNDIFVLNSLSDAITVKIFRPLYMANAKPSTIYTVRYEVISGYEYFRNMLMFENNFTTNVSSNAKTDVLTATTKDSFVTNNLVLCYMKDDAPLNAEVKIKISITEGSEEKPIIPPGYTFPDGALSFDGTEGMNLETYSYVMKNTVSNEEGSTPNSVYFRGPSNTPYAENAFISDNMLFGNQYEYPSITVSNIGNGIIGMGDTIVDINSSVNFTQFVSYNESLTQDELETELAKNLYIPGEVDVVAKIENSMKIGAVLGKRPKGDIQDNTGTTVVGDIYYDEANEKYYECKTATDETFIDSTKWEERSIDNIINNTNTQLDTKVDNTDFNTQMNLKADKTDLASLIDDSVPDDRLYGALWVENGRLKATGILTRIHGLADATIDEYGVVNGTNLSFILPSSSSGFYIRESFTYAETLTDDTLPKIGVGQTFPGGEMKFDGTEDLNFEDYSYMWEHCTSFRRDLDDEYYSNLAKKDNAKLSNYQSTNPINDETYLFSSETENSIWNRESSAYPDMPLLTIGGNFYCEQFVVYKGTLSLIELRAERDKALKFNNTVDISTQIENNNKIVALLGVKPKGNIQDRINTTIVGDIWYDTASRKYYECLTPANENFIDPVKWGERSLLSAPYITISGYKIEVV